MNAPAIRIDPRAAWLARASALEILYLVGEVTLDTAIEELTDQFFAIVGAAAKPPRRLNGGAP
jgi:hypothetical protein